MTGQELNREEVTAPPSLALRTRNFLSGHVKMILAAIGVALFLKMFVIEAYRIPTESMENTLLVGDFLFVNKLAYGFRTPREIPLINARVSSFALPVFSNVKRGDVIVFEYPGERDELKPRELTYFVKRCIGLPGDRVEIRKGEIFVNGHRMQTPETAIFAREKDFGPVIVPYRGERLVLTPENADDWMSFIAREGHKVRINGSEDITIDGRKGSEYTVERDYFFVMGDNRANSMDSRSWGYVPDDNIIGEALFVYWSWNPGIPAPGAGERMNSIRWERVGKIIR